MYDFVGSFWPLLLVLLFTMMAVLLRGKNTFFHWAARIMAILDIIFLAWESLEQGAYVWGDFFTDNMLTSIPLLLILLAAWKKDLVGSIGFCLAGVFMLVYFEWGDFPNGFLPMVIGVFFFVSWRKKRQK